MGTARFKIARWMIVTWLVAMLSSAAGLAGEELSDRQLNKLSRQATKAQQAGQQAEARDSFEQLLSATQPGDGRRATALYAVLTFEVLSAGEVTPVAEGLLDELLESFPSHSQRSEIEIVDRWRRQSRAAKAQLADLRRDMAEQEAACETKANELVGEAGEKENQLKRDNQRLRKDLRVIRQQLESTKAELAKKEEALEKLKDALVSGG